jgi:hypothetical protein
MKTSTDIKICQFLETCTSATAAPFMHFLDMLLAECKPSLTLLAHNAAAAKTQIEQMKADFAIIKAWLDAPVAGNAQKPNNAAAIMAVMRELTKLHHFKQLVEEHLADL